MPKKSKASLTTSEPPKLGDVVSIRYHPDLRGQVVELRGPLGPGGAQVYRLLLRRRPRRAYVEVREDQIKVIRRADANPQPAAASE